MYGKSRGRGYGPLLPTPMAGCSQIIGGRFSLFSGSATLLCSVIEAHGLPGTITLQQGAQRGSHHTVLKSNNDGTTRLVENEFSNRSKI